MERAETMYDHVSSFGTFAIRPDQCGRGGWCLWLEDELLGTYATATAAALAVHDHTTGHAAWDGRYIEEIPAELAQWTAGYWATTGGFAAARGKAPPRSQPAG